MSDLISRSALMEHIKDLPTWWADDGGVYPGSMKYPEGMYYPEDIISSIESAPTIEAVEVVHGRWVPADGEGESPCDEWDCTACGERRTFVYDMDEYDMEENYPRCPKCGAYMKGGVE